ncbi:MAG: YraN family protein [Deltaproteobacteria bacterium]|nr:MAG: YraN family protein [Deltaproteobacteria bacterium]
MGKAHRLGKKGEDLATEFLKKSGYRILKRNYRCPFGEVDIIAEDGGVLAFVEVKARSSDSYGSPAEAVDWRKRDRVARVASHYLQRRGLEGKVPVRFDVVCLNFSPIGPIVELIKGAFGLEG